MYLAWKSFLFFVNKVSLLRCSLDVGFPGVGGYLG